MPIEPALPRFTIEPTVDGQRARIPSRRHVFFILFAAGWLIAWFAGETNAIHQLSDKGFNLFLIGWLAAWTAGGAWTLACLLWQIAGQETLTLTPDTLSYRVEIFGMGRTRMYARNDIRQLRVIESVGTTPFQQQNGWAPPFSGTGTGPVAFDYGARTVQLGAALEAAEARQLVETLRGWGLPTTSGR